MSILKKIKDFFAIKDTIQEVKGISVFHNKTYIFHLDKNGGYYFTETKQNKIKHDLKDITVWNNYLGRKFKLDNCSDFSFTETDSGISATFQNTDKKGITSYYNAHSTNLINWTVTKQKLQSGSTPKRINTNNQFLKKFLIASTPTRLQILETKNQKTWKELETIDLSTIEGHFHNTPVKVVGAFEQPNGILVIFNASTQKKGYYNLKLGAILLNKENPGHTIWKLHMPFWEELISKPKNNIKIIGSSIDRNNITIYILEGKKTIYSIDLPNQHNNLEVNHQKAHLHKLPQNPIISPIETSDWESVSTFNPAAFKLNDTIHLLYRAEGYHGLSRLGHAWSEDGYTYKRMDKPIYWPRTHFEGYGLDPVTLNFPYASGYGSKHSDYYKDIKITSGWHGTEDPRATLIDDKIYVLYSAFPGNNYSRLAITHIKVDDFLNGEYNWSEPIPLTPQPNHWGEGSKNACLLPEKINGKYVIFHRIWPDICIDYVDNLEFGEGKKWLQTKRKIKTLGSSWDSRKVAVGAPPIKTKLGWLIIYQGMGWQDPRSQYKIGAMIVDKKDPSKILYRTSHPILTPSESYENNGHKAGVAFPCGAVIHKNKLYVYYGASDRTIAVGTADLDDFLDKLKQEPYKEPKLKAIK